MSLPLRQLKHADLRVHDGDPHLNEEWLVTNGLGGYASGTVAGALTRRYHGLLIAALPNPLGRTMTLNALSERIRLPNRDVFFTGPNELVGVDPPGTLAPRQFRLEGGLPVWRYELGGFVLEKRIFMIYRQNTVHVTYSLLSGPEPIRIALRPGLHFRSHDASVSTPLAKKYILTITDDTYEVCAADTSCPALRMMCLPAKPFTADRKKINDILFRTEETRGYEAQGSMWSPGYFRLDLKPGEKITFIATTEKWDIQNALTPEGAVGAETIRRDTLLEQANPAAREGFGAELTLAADQFLILPTGRTEDAARAHAAGEELRTVIAGYHWFTDWGRDTMIALEGLTIATGRVTEAGWILRTFSQYIRDGLIPNMFPEGQQAGLYHTADATMWFFHAVARYLAISGDRVTLRVLIPKLIDVIDHHLKGTKFGIHIDPADGLFHQGQEGYQLTWMDAKVGDWVVTPRRGKAVEINALWYNALRLLEGWLIEEERPAEAKRFADLAVRARDSFNRRFWNEPRGCLFDVIDGEKGDDPACRPNQIFAISLSHPVLATERWEAVLTTVKRELLTPVGLRSLSPKNPDYKPKYDGDLRARDAAYHQGTVWAWLIGPFIDAWLRVYPERRDEAKGFLAAFEPHLSEACIGSISEVFDAEQPHTPRACIAQAWSVAEVLRCHVLLQSKDGSGGGV
ncbi:MAG TPA: amylo-alpha-1,6-glucosidase [Bryobacteraceae bacterium]|nr:amylo-alpha-1,6-glucosidase [Bryobacteraceae bacterium]